MITTIIIPRRHTTPVRWYKRKGRKVRVGRVLFASEVCERIELEVKFYTTIKCESKDDAIALIEDLFYGEDG